MSLHAPLVYCIPDETARVAHAAFPKGNRYMRMRDELGPIYINPEFAPLFPKVGQPAEAPAHLALITIMQFAEGLSDAQAAEAVRGRLDWKYALALELSDPGFDSSVLSEFRSRLIQGNAELMLFETMLTLFREQGLLKTRGRQRTDSTHVLAAIQVLNRLECIGETVRHTLNTLAVVAPGWLRTWVPSVWFDRYGRRFEEYRLPPGKSERYTLAAQIGADGAEVLTKIYAPSTPAWLREVPAVQTLRQVWLQQFYAALPDQPVCWRTAEDLPPAAQLISSPYDPDARYSKKRDTEWTGYTVHLTETCDDETPNRITDVITTPATTQDVTMTRTIHANLAARELTPGEHLVDASYVTAEYLVTSGSDYGTDLIGPVGEDRSWQAQAGTGFSAAQFVIDWEAQRATCPNGKTTEHWLTRSDRQGPAVQIKFAADDCRDCALRVQCTRSASGGRWVTVPPQAEYEALQTARARQTTVEFKTLYACRAGIEGTVSQGVRLGDLRRSRYIGLAKTRLMHFVLAAALNFLRVAAWLAETPRARTRRSAFAVLASVPG